MYINTHCFGDNILKWGCVCGRGFKHKHMCNQFNWPAIIYRPMIYGTIIIFHIHINSTKVERDLFRISRNLVWGMGHIRIKIGFVHTMASELELIKK